MTFQNTNFTISFVLAIHFQRGFLHLRMNFRLITSILICPLLDCPAFSLTLSSVCYTLFSFSTAHVLYLCNFPFQNFPMWVQSLKTEFWHPCQPWSLPPHGWPHCTMSSAASLTLFYWFIGNNIQIYLDGSCVDCCYYLYAGFPEELTHNNLADFCQND